MSSVIKNVNMLLSSPIVIDIDEPNEETEEKDVEEIVWDTEKEALSALELEQQQMEHIKQESQNVLIETENMVMELLQKARDESKNIIGDAREEAEAIKAQAAQEAAQIKEKTRQEAYEEGLKKAQAEIEADRQLAMQQSQEMLEEARQSKIKMFRSCETDMVRLVIAISKKIIAGELQTNPNIMVNVLREAIDYLDRPENISVYVNPREMDSVLEVMKNGQLTDIGSNNLNLQIKADKRISSGGCLVESDAGSVDAQLENRTDSVFNAILEVTAG